MSGWEDIRAEVLHRIRTRVWPLGTAIPHEEALAVEFGCARPTVNRALRDLAAQGVLERRRKGGTRVMAIPVRKATLNIPVIRAEVEVLGMVHSHRVILQQLRVPTDARAMALGLQAPVLHLETLHLANDRPFVHELRWLNPDALPPLPDFSQISANEWLVTTVTYATGDITFSADAASEAEAAHLDVAQGAALFITERVTRDAAGGVITLVRLAHAPGYQLRTVM
jgi:GntR family transcriptional regulator, histidine utilization repressor